MFGSVRPFKPELKISEYESYRAIYCTLCKRLGKQYGWLLRATLNYDFTFLALVGLSLQDQPCAYKKGHCVYNPFKSCVYLEQQEALIDRVAAMSALMLYHKAEDNVQDERGVRRLFYRLFRALVRPAARKATLAEPEAAAILAALTQRQAALEAASCNAEEAAEPTADALGQLCRLFAVNEVDRTPLYRMGYCVGKWVYLVDAWKDRSEDAKRDRFNPLHDTMPEAVRPLMNLCSGEAGEAFERLPALYMAGIVRNILYLGLPHEQERIFAQKETTA